MNDDEILAAAKAISEKRRIDAKLKMLDGLGDEIVNVYLQAEGYRQAKHIFDIPASDLVTFARTVLK